MQAIAEIVSEKVGRVSAMIKNSAPDPVYKGPPPVYEVGGKYLVQAKKIPVFAKRSLEQQVTIVDKQEVVMVVGSDPPTGFQERLLVMPMDFSKSIGWVSVQATKATSQKPTYVLGPVLQPGSWEKKGKYLVKHPAVLRQGVDLDSAWVGEVSPQDEVMLLELGVCFPIENRVTKARLRALVCTQFEVIGWISPETGQGDFLLEPLNLLSAKVVEEHKLALQGRKSVLGGLRKSVMAGLPVPWKVNCCYRALEILPIQEDPHSKPAYAALQVPAGAVIKIHEIQSAELGLTMARIITVTENGKPDPASLKGWVRLNAADGHDVVGTYHIHEWDEIMEKMRRSVGVTQNLPPSVIQAQMIQAGIPNVLAEEAVLSEGSDEDDEEDEAYPASPPAAAVAPSPAPQNSGPNGINGINGINKIPASPVLEEEEEEDGDDEEESEEEEEGDDDVEVASSAASPVKSPTMENAKKPEMATPVSAEDVKLTFPFQKIDPNFDKKDDRLIQDRTEIEEPTSNCACNCGAGRNS